MNNIFKYFKKPFITLLIIGFILPFFPQKTHAAYPVTLIADTSISGIKNAINLQMDNLKSFTLDKIATMIAKQMLHRMTMDVVGWINGGFKGNPAFLTNPTGFLLDSADQVTGAFINGPLSKLCSPFNIDIRLGLALNQVSLADQRYDCTLGKIIEAQKNGPSIAINGQTIRSSNGTMNGFLGGDFNQGGWPAFIALTTEPQNNPYGSRLWAQSELQTNIASKQNTITADLQMGAGFMSWPNCKTLAVAKTEQEASDYDLQYADDPTLNIKGNKDGSTTYESCEIQTPGSVISGSLQKSLNVPADELELANDINAVVNALVTQMISTMITSGLHSLSSGSTGGPSYTQQLIQDSNSGVAAQAELSNLKPAISDAIDQVNIYKYSYDQAISILTDSKNRYLAAKACYVAKQGTYSSGGSYNTEFDSQNIANINNTIETQIDPLIKDLQVKQAEAVAANKELREMSNSLSSTGSSEVVMAQAQKYSDYVKQGGLYVQPKIDAAQAALDNAQTQAQTFNNDANQLQSACRRQY